MRLFERYFPWSEAGDRVEAGFDVVLVYSGENMHIRYLPAWEAIWGFSLPDTLTSMATHCSYLNEVGDESATI